MRGYTPAHARRIAALTRADLVQMQRLVDWTLAIANDPGPDTLARQRMPPRTLPIVFRRYSTEHRSWARHRQHGADSDEDNSRFGFLNEVADIVSSDWRNWTPP